MENLWSQIAQQKSEEIKNVYDLMQVLKGSNSNGNLIESVAEGEEETVQPMPLDATANFNIFFRGESKDFGDTSLLPSVFRVGNEKKHYFDALANFPDELLPLPELSKIARMQHFKYPTRLLDLTTNPLVGLWFSCFENDKEDGCFYSITPDEKKECVITYESDKALMLACLAKLKEEDRPDFLNFLSFVIERSAGQTNVANPNKINKNYLDAWKILTSNDNINASTSAFEKFLDEVCRERPAFYRDNISPYDLFRNYIVRPMTGMGRLKRQHGAFAIFGVNNAYAAPLEISSNQAFSISLKESENVLNPAYTIKVNLTAKKGDIIYTIGNNVKENMTDLPKIVEGGNYKITPYIVVENNYTKKTYKVRPHREALDNNANIINNVGNLDYAINKYIIPKASKKEIIKELDALGINKATLFGDMESRADYNKEKQIFI